MDNNDIFTGSGTIADLSAAAHAETPKPKSKLPLYICIGVVALALLAVAVYFIFLRKDSASDENTEPVVKTTYITPADSEDPEGDYIKYLEKQKSSAKTADEALYATLDEASLKIMLKKYDEALEILDGINTGELSDTSLHQLYSAYARLYAPTALDDPNLYAVYQAKVEAEYKIITGETTYE